MSAQAANRWDWQVLAGLLVVVFAVAAIGSAVTLPKIPGWYASLAKPAFSPPNQVFGPVWTTLYVLMAVAAWRVGRRHGKPNRRSALAWWAAQLALNAAWSPLFFGLERPDWAMAVIVLLLAVLVWTAWRIYAVDRVASALLWPYLAWVVFASALNGAIVALN
jgi:tryptophan-rich sensory protein